MLWTVVIGKDTLLLNAISQGCEHHKWNPINLHSIGVKAGISEVDKTICMGKYHYMYYLFIKRDFKYFVRNCNANLTVLFALVKPYVAVIEV